MIVVIAHNIRSTHNVGSIFRTCDGFGVTKLYLTGYTPAPHYDGDTRLPHIAEKLTKQIHKTALGAEQHVRFEKVDDVANLLAGLTMANFAIVALEQAPHSIPLSEYRPDHHIALVLGEEVNGIEPDVLHKADVVVEIPMKGKKESFNVSVAAGIALYALSMTDR